MRRLYRSLSVLACLGLILTVAAGARNGVRASEPVRDAAIRLYKLGSQGDALQPLDARSLANLPRARPLAFGPRHDITINHAPRITVTADGSKFVVLYTREPRHGLPDAYDMRFRLFDARSGRALTPWRHPAVPLSMLALSADGSRLVGTRSDVNQPPCAPVSFYVLATRDGSMRHVVRARVSPAQPALADPSLHYLYVMDEPDAINTCGPAGDRSPTVAAYSLVTGRQLASIRLPSVRAGRWLTTQVVRGQTVLADQQPGFALSPDGSQLAVLDGSSNRLSLLKAPSLRLEATESVVTWRSGWDLVAELLGLAPQVAEAKGEVEGTNLQMRYAADGRSLLVTGSQLRPDPRRRFPVDVPLGLRRIDVATGQVKVQLASREIYSLWVAPDGSAIYSLVQGTARPQLCPCTIRRHDPATLAILGSRTFWNDTGFQIYLLRSTR